MSMLGGLPGAVAQEQEEQARPSEASSIKNSFSRLAVDPDKGFFSVWRRDRPFLLNARSVAVGAGPFDLGDARYRRTALSRRIEDPLGAGEELVLHAKDSKKEADLELRLTLYDDLDAFFAELAIGNASGRPLSLNRLEPVRARMDESAALLWTSADKVRTNGYLYSDPGAVVDLTHTSRREIESVWNLALYSMRSHETLVIGGIDHSRADSKGAAAGTSEAR